MAEKPPDGFGAGIEFMGKVADTVSFMGLAFDAVNVIKSLGGDQKEPDPLIVLLNSIHSELNAIEDIVLAIWVQAREDNIAFLLSHSAPALQTANAFVKSEASKF